MNSEFKIGHYTDTAALTGCTVVLCPPKTKASCEVRGASPASRELILLAPDKGMQEIHAVLLTGGSAFGLSAADGVVRYLEEQKIGYETPWAKVPIVPAAAVFDLNVGSSTVRPDGNAGYQACKNAKYASQEQGNIGAGTGATVGKWKGLEYCMKGGLGLASRSVNEVTMTALAVVNAVGDIVNGDGSILAGARSREGKFFGESDPVRRLIRGKILDQANTTLVVLATNANFNKVELHRICQRLHDGIARSIIPAHTSFDGDATFALSSGEVRAEFDLVAEVGAQLTSEAIRNAVKQARSIPGIPGLHDN